MLKIVAFGKDLFKDNNRTQSKSYFGCSYKIESKSCTELILSKDSCPKMLKDANLEKSNML